MTAKQLIESFHDWQRQGRSLVLATVFETEGSTYSKAGARMLITDDGRFQGMLSGGCLEGDLAERAAQVLASGLPQSVTYDLGSNDEELWGLGVGCDGLMRIFLQALGPSCAYEPFATMSTCLGGDSAAVAATILESDNDDWPAATTVVTDGHNVIYSTVDSATAGPLSAIAEKVLTEGESRTHSLQLGGGDVQVLFGLLTPPPRLLVLGAGLDAEPVARLAGDLGWKVVVQDHRSAYIDNGTFDSAEEVLCVPADEIASALRLDDFDAAIVMSHHLATDRKYIARLLKTSIHYIGLLGPRGRRDRILEEVSSEVGKAAVELSNRVHGPAGIDLGARGPAAIALSIVAEIQRSLLTAPTA